MMVEIHQYFQSELALLCLPQPDVLTFRSKPRSKSAECLDQKTSNAMLKDNAASCAGAAGEVSSSMMVESEEGVSQLGSLAFTQAEANLIEENFTVMLQVRACLNLSILTSKTGEYIIGAPSEE